jgi:uncharacterized NAD-dependent epimerase/dehydratase family protein
MQLINDRRLAILLHEGIRGFNGKTGLTLLRYGEAPVVAVIDQQCAGQSLSQLTGIACDAPIVDSVASALAYQPDVLAIGIAPSGGVLPDAWWQEIKQGVAAGLSIINGLHTPMASDPELQSLLKEGQVIWDIRQEPTGLSVGSGQARSLSVSAHPNGWYGYERRQDVGESGIKSSSRATRDTLEVPSHRASGV